MIKKIKIEWIDKIERKNVTWKHTIIIEKCKHLKKFELKNDSITSKVVYLNSKIEKENITLKKLCVCNFVMLNVLIEFRSESL
jgi:hypothetical protein